MGGIEAPLTNKKGNRIYKKKADGDFEAHLVALSCSEPPEGYARWSLRLLADKVVELHILIAFLMKQSVESLQKRN